MDRSVAFFDLTASSSQTKPLMLHELLFCPVLSWACEELSVRGIQRFFVVCDEMWKKDVLACFPKDADVTWTDREQDVPADAKAVRDPVMPRGEMMLPFHSYEELNRLKADLHRFLAE